ncbi:hypothetical protein RUM43_012010, partial [Polyplax serrata]
YKQTRVERGRVSSSVEVPEGKHKLSGTCNHPVEDIRTRAKGRISTAPIIPYIIVKVVKPSAP